MNARKRIKELGAEVERLERLYHLASNNLANALEREASELQRHLLAERESDKRNARLRFDLANALVELDQPCRCVTARIREAHEQHQAKFLDPYAPDGGLTPFEVAFPPPAGASHEGAGTQSAYNPGYDR